MKPMGENELLHLGNTIADWRVIAAWLHHAATMMSEQKDHDRLNQLAERIEMHLPSNDGSKTP